MEARELMDYKNWVVVGDVLNNSKYAHKILDALNFKGYNVKGINPKGGSEEIFTSLGEVPYKIDVIDLCINPVKGLEFMKEAKELNIDKILIQPGAESEEIISYCKENGITAVEGCALVEIANRGKVGK